MRLLLTNSVIHVVRQIGRKSHSAALVANRYGARATTISISNTITGLLFPAAYVEAALCDSGRLVWCYLGQSKAMTSQFGIVGCDRRDDRVT